MADSRIKDLSDEIISSELDSLLDTLYIAADDGTFTDAHKVLWKTLLSNEIVEQDSEIDTHALTPKGFAASVASLSRRGIVRFATASEITNREGSGVIGAYNLRQAQSDERARIFEHVGQPTIYWKNTRTAAWEVNQFVSPVAGASGTLILPPVEAESSITSAAIQISIQANTISHSGFYSINSGESVSIASGITLRIDGANTLKVDYSGGFAFVSITAFITATVE